jgi:hypothetical protein
MFYSPLLYKKGGDFLSSRCKRLHEPKLIHMDTFIIIIIILIIISSAPVYPKFSFDSSKFCLLFSLPSTSNPETEARSDV